AVSPGVVSFSPDSPVPPDISPEARAYFLLRRPVRGAPARSAPDCLDPAQRATFLQYRENLRQYWESAAGTIKTPFTRQVTTMDGVNVTWLTTSNTGRSGKVILYLHAGAYIIGNAHANAAGLVSLVQQTGIRLLA